MKAQIECLPCIYNQILRVSKIATQDDLKIEKILKLAARELSSANLKMTPPELAQPLYELVSQITGNEDPYRAIKKEHINKALELYPELKKLISSSKDPLLKSVEIAIVGNAIDLGSKYDKVEIDFDKLAEGNFIPKDYEELKNKIRQVKEILFIGDNAGESVFDRCLIETLEENDKIVKYVVKSKPIINDVTKEDAEDSRIKNIIESGSKFSGTVIYSLSNEFKNIIKNTKLIIAKGQANYETFSNENLPIFFLLKVKCEPISRATGYPIGSFLVLKSKNTLNSLLTPN